MRKVMWLILFSGSLLGLVDWGRCQDITLDGDIRDFAVGNMSLYVLTDEHLYKVSHHLAQITDKISQRGRLGKDGKFERSSDSSSVGESTYKVNLLVPFIRNNTLITCGSIECGYCEVLDMNDFSKSVHYEQIDVSPNGSAIAFVVDIQTTRNTLETYIFAASMLSTRNKCPAEDSVVTLRNTNDRQTGEIFSDKDQDRLPAKLTTKDMSFNFVDGFQNDKYIYLFRNHRNGSVSVQLIWLEVKTDKKKTFASLQGAQLWCCADRERPQLLSSSLMSGGPPVLWAGVFTSNDTRDPLNTALAIYDVSPGTGPDPVFCSNHACKPKSENKPQPLKLVPVSVVFHYQSMTSVLAITQGSWVVFFIGTGDGQLIKLAVDKNYNSSCSRVIFRSDSDVQVFPKMHLDPVDPRHIYMVLGNQMKRVPVATCSLSITPKDCWISQDPFCGWCESKSSCTFKMDCSNSTWISIPDDSKQQQISHLLQRNSNGQITLTIQVHLSVVGPIPVFTCNLMPGNVLCPPSFPTCTCSNTTLSPGMFVRVRLGKPQLVKELKLVDCSTITGPPTFDLCSQCVSAGCSWRNQSCSWTQHPANTHLTQDAVCQMDQPGRYSKPEIFSILPAEVSFHGRNHALLTGSNLSHVTRVRIQGRFDCSPKESPVWSNTGSTLRFHIPAGDKGLVTVCLILPDGSCHGTGRVTYISAPSCSELTPSTTWASGGRRIRARGTHLELVEGVIHGNAPQVIATNYSAGDFLFYTPPMDHSEVPVNVNMKVANHSVFCHPLTFQQDPRFISFTYTATGNNLRVTIQKEADKLNISKSDLTVLAMEDDKEYECVLDIIETSNGTDSIDCDILNKPNAKIDFLRIKFGDFAGFELRSEQQSAARMALLILPVFLVILVIVLGVVCIYRNKQRKLTAEMNERLELLECDIRQEIRQGFVDLQTDHSDLIENMGAIPFLDYKHFASRIFFPEGGPIATTIVKDIGQDVVKVRLEQSCQALSTLIQDQLFLTSMIHALEEQKTFTIKDKCKVASLLSVALHGDLPYLTSVMEGLLRALMDQPSNNQPKLLLRRTESIVEKLLTNWMSICLYGFLRESAGQHLFLLVSALTQQISKGPVDSVTEKALYTLNEDWLLYQAPDFIPLKLKALFAVGTDGEVSDPLEVAALSCDTVEQVKEKILLAHKNKFGFPYSSPLRDIHIECEQDGRFAALQEVDSSSQVLGDVTMLNTLRHYQVSDGMTLKVVSRRTQPPLSPQGSLKDDLNFSAKYFHLIDPEVIQDQRKNPERKKLKLKEVHLTKLLSTKVAVHSYVEKLFRTIWGTTNGNAPCVVKYFFDFLDAQADSKRISDPDVTHIWKTNSLPLRFWVNILKNPQFVFDMEKSPHLDSCLSVIAQAFMDSFSLSEIQLGKHAATNKLLYAKDIPLYKQEVKAYYKQIKDQPKMTSSEFKDFLLEESKKHENEFNESEALRELYKCMQRYFDAIKLKLEQNGASVELQQQLQNVKVLFDDLKSSSWD